MDRALSTSQIIAGINCAMQDFLTIRAGHGLSFHGNIEVIDGNIELYNLFVVFKDVIIKGAKTANIFGAEINIKQLGKNLDRGNDWHFGSKLSPAEIQEFEKQFAANYQNMEELEELAQDGEDEQVTKNKQKYFIFFQNLEDEVTQAEESGGSKADLQAMLHISQVLYKKEQSDAIKEGRPIKDFGEFVGHLNQHIYNNSIFAGKVHDNIVKILLKTQLVVDQKYAIISGGQAKGIAYYPSIGVLLLELRYFIF